MRPVAYIYLLAVAVVLGCGDDDPVVSHAPPANYSLTAPTTDVTVGQDSTVNLKNFGVNVVREDGVVIPGPNTTTAPNLPRLSYFPEDLNTVVIAENGDVRGLRGGTTMVRVTGYDNEISFPVTVRPYPSTTVRLSVLSGPDGGFKSTARLDTGTFYALPADLETSRLEGLVLVGTDTVYCNYCVVAPAPAPVRTPRFVRFRSLDTTLATVTNPGTPTLQTSVIAAARVRPLDTSSTPVLIVMEVPGDSAPGAKWADTVSLIFKLRPIDTLRLDPGTHRVDELERPDEDETGTSSKGQTTLFENRTWPGDSTGANVVQSSSENFSLVASFRSRVRSVPAPPGTAAPTVTFVTMQNTNATTASYRPVLPGVTWESALPSYLLINTAGGVVGLCEYIGRVDRCPAPTRGSTAATQTARDSLIIKCTDTNTGAPPNRRLPGTKLAVPPATTGLPVNPPIVFGGVGNLSIPGCPVVGSAVGPNIPMPGALCTSANVADLTSTCTVWVRAKATDPVTGRLLTRLYRVNIKKS